MATILGHVTPEPLPPPSPPPSPHTPGADQIREKDGIFAVLCWLSLLPSNDCSTSVVS